jgi:hypothetical protein
MFVVVRPPESGLIYSWCCYFNGLCRLPFLLGLVSLFPQPTIIADFRSLVNLPEELSIYRTSDKRAWKGPGTYA